MSLKVLWSNVFSNFQEEINCFRQIECFFSAALFHDGRWRSWKVMGGEGDHEYLHLSHTSSFHRSKEKTLKMCLFTIENNAMELVVWRQMPKLTALLQCCIATSLHPKSVQTESTLRYFAASLQSMPAWKQHISRCFVASLQSYIRCQSELKAASAALLLCYNRCQPEHNTSLAASLLHCNLI